MAATQRALLKIFEHELEINQERRLGQIMHGMNPDEIGNALKQLAELHTRPQSVQIEEEVGELPF